MDFVHARLREVSASHPAVRLSVKQRLGLAPPPTRHPHAPQHRPSPQQQQHAHTAQHGHGVPLMRCRTSPVPAMQALAAASAATVAVRQLRRSGTALSPAAFTSPGARVAVTVPSARVEEDGRAGVATGASRHRLLRHARSRTHAAAALHAATTRQSHARSARAASRPCCPRESRCGARPVRACRACDHKRARAPRAQPPARSMLRRPLRLLRAMPGLPRASQRRGDEGSDACATPVACTATMFRGWRSAASGTRLARYAAPAPPLTLALMRASCSRQACAAAARTGGQGAGRLHVPTVCCRC